MQSSKRNVRCIILHMHHQVLVFLDHLVLVVVGRDYQKRELLLEGENYEIKIDRMRII